MTREFVAIVGRRGYPRLDRVREFVRALPEGTVVVSGHARGVDAAAEHEADRCGLAVNSFPAEWSRYGRSAGFKRNALIVEQADRVVAFWDGVSNGTKHTIDTARAVGKPVEIVLP